MRTIFPKSSMPVNGRNFSFPIIKLSLFICFLFFGINPDVQAQCTGPFTIFTEDFEDHGNTANGGSGRYMSPNDFMDITTDDDYWGRIQAVDQQYFLTDAGSGVAIHINVPYTGQNGNFYYAGEDVDDVGATVGNPDGVKTKVVLFPDINIDGGTNMCFSGLFARGENDACGSSIYDQADYLKVIYSIDGGPEIEGLCFHADLECNIPMDISNEPLFHDPDCDGDGGEGTLLTSTLTSFSFDIAGTGTSLALRIEAHMDAGSEEIAFDYLQIASDTEVISCAVTASFVAPEDICINAGTAEYSGGLPVPGTGQTGVYSGPGVTDNGDGMTYLFDPFVAGEGIHTITYTFNEGDNCPDAVAMDQIEVFPFSIIDFSQPPNFCINDDDQLNIGEVSPQGGVFSGPGVTDNGNGADFNFSPSAAGIGTQSITYSFTNANGCPSSGTVTIEVYDIPAVSLSLPDTIFATAGMPPSGVNGTGTPEGGVYTDAFGEITDDGNGMTFSFDTLFFGSNTITYTYTDPATGCTNSASHDFILAEEPVSIDDLEIIDIKVYPNPTSGKLELSGQPIDAIQVISIDGKVLMNFRNPGSGIDISEVPGGVYWLKIQVDDYIINKRIVKQ